MATTKDKRRGAAAQTTSARSIVSGPSKKDAGVGGDAFVAKMDATEATAVAMPFNANKVLEYGRVSMSS